MMKIISRIIWGRIMKMNDGALIGWFGKLSCPPLSCYFKFTEKSRVVECHCGEGLVEMGWRATTDEHGVDTGLVQCPGEGEEVLRSVTPGQQIVKTFHDELLRDLGWAARSMKPAFWLRPPAAGSRCSVNR